jgi:DNA end-binding protein Ku
VRVRDGLLALTTMLFADEIRDTKGIAPGGKKPEKKAVDQAVKLIEALSDDFDPSAFEDEHRKRVQKVIKDKQKGGTIEAPEQDEEPAPATDLMEALRKTMEELNTKSSKKSSSSPKSKSSSSKAKGRSKSKAKA